jgi:hypothetical protein
MRGLPQLLCSKVRPMEFNRRPSLAEDDACRLNVGYGFLDLVL